MTKVVDKDPMASVETYSDDNNNSGDDDDSPPPRLAADQVRQYPEIWQEILQGDVIGKNRSLVNTCRRSPQRRESLRDWITSGKASGKWDIKPLQLLCDVDTRWSSVFFMIDRYLHLHKVSSSFGYNCLTNSTEGCS
jgi:hypothetical protein